MDLKSTSCTSDDFVFRILCDVLQCLQGFLKSGWNCGILVHECNQGLSGYRSKWMGEGIGYGIKVWAMVGVRVGNKLALTLIEKRGYS